MIPEEKINKYLDMLLTKSEPGDCLHELLVVAAPEDAGGPFGFATEDDQKISLYAIAYTEGQTTDTLEQFICKTLLASVAEHGANGQRILFMALKWEVNMVSPMDELAHRLSKEGRLSEHPGCGEATMVYAACRDGRRWMGIRWLTGPKAGRTIGPDAFTGPVDRGRESFGRFGYLMRRIVGIE